MKTIILQSHTVEAIWQTSDAVLVKTVQGKIWFCKKVDKEEFSKQITKFKQGEPVEFELRPKRRGNGYEKN